MDESTANINNDSVSESSNDLLEETEMKEKSTPQRRKRKKKTKTKKRKTNDTNKSHLHIVEKVLGRRVGSNGKVKMMSEGYEIDKHLNIRLLFLGSIFN